MFKRIKKQTYLVIAIIILLLVIVVLIYNKDKIRLLGDRIRNNINANTEEITVDYKIMSLNGEEMKVLFTVNDNLGIEKIISEDIEMNPKGKTTLAFDRTFKEGDVYQLKIKTQGNDTEQLFTFVATTKPRLQIINKDILGDGTKQRAEIYYPDNENITKYYSLDDGETWEVYGEYIDIPIEKVGQVLMKIEWFEGKTINIPLRETEIISVTYDEENATRKINITYNENGDMNQTTKYYRIGETRAWQQYTGEITLLDSQIDIVDIKEGTNKLVIYAKQVLNGIDVTQTYYEEEITTAVKYDVFNHMRLTGTTLAEYGFTASWVKKEDAAFAIGNFEAGHHGANANWSGTFTLKNPKSFGATHLYIDFYQWVQRISSTSQTTVTAVYEDGTSTVKQNAILTTKTTNYKHYPTTLELNDKKISYIQFYLNGYDDHASASKAKLTNIIFKGIQLPVTE